MVLQPHLLVYCVVHLKESMLDNKNKDHVLESDGHSACTAQNEADLVTANISASQHSLAASDDDSTLKAPYKAFDPNTDSHCSVKAVPGGGKCKEGTQFGDGDVVAKIADDMACTLECDQPAGWFTWKVNYPGQKTYKCECGLFSCKLAQMPRCTMGSPGMAKQIFVPTFIVLLIGGALFACCRGLALTDGADIKAAIADMKKQDLKEADIFPVGYGVEYWDDGYKQWYEGRVLHFSWHDRCYALDVAPVVHYSKVRNPEGCGGAQWSESQEYQGYNQQQWAPQGPQDGGFGMAPAGQQW